MAADAGFAGSVSDANFGCSLAGSELPQEYINDALSANAANRSNFFISKYNKGQK
jgi:hypothetical protein